MPAPGPGQPVPRHAHDRERSVRAGHGAKSISSPGAGPSPTGPLRIVSGRLRTCPWHVLRCPPPTLRGPVSAWPSARRAGGVACVRVRLRAPRRVLSSGLRASSDMPLACPHPRSARPRSRRLGPLRRPLPRAPGGAPASLVAPVRPPCVSEHAPGMFSDALRPPWALLASRGLPPAAHSAPPGPRPGRGQAAPGVLSLTRAESASRVRARRKPRPPALAAGALRAGLRAPPR